MVVDIVFAVLGVGGTLGFMGYLIYLAIVGAPERDREVAAREHLRRTGQWPDGEVEPPAERTPAPAASRPPRIPDPEQATADGSGIADRAAPNAPSAP